MDAAFLVADVPAAGSILGQLTVDAPDVEVDLVGRPDMSGAGHGYVLDYVVGPISKQTWEPVAARLAPLYTSFETREEGGGRWRVRGTIPLASIQAPALRLVAGLYGLTQAPWLMLRGGRALAMLRPRDEGSAEMLAALVRARLLQLQVQAEVRLEYLPLAPYEERRARLAGPLAPLDRARR